MTSDLRELYQEVVLDHGKNPRNCRNLDGATTQSVGFNPLCGDKLTLYLRTDGDKILDISFQGAGCAISMASVSLLTEALRGKSRAEAERLGVQFVALLTGENSKSPDREALGKLTVLSGVREFPVRVKCATLAWRVLEAALRNEKSPVTTE